MTTKQLIADTLPSGWKIGKLKYFSLLSKTKIS